MPDLYGMQNPRKPLWYSNIPLLVPHNQALTCPTACAVTQALTWRFPQLTAAIKPPSHSLVLALQLTMSKEMDKDCFPAGKAEARFLTALN